MNKTDYATQDKKIYATFSSLVNASWETLLRLLKDKAENPRPYIPLQVDEVKILERYDDGFVRQLKVGEVQFKERIAIDEQAKQVTFTLIDNAALTGQLINKITLLDDNSGGLPIITYTFNLQPISEQAARNNPETVQFFTHLAEMIQQAVLQMKDLAEQQDVGNSVGQKKPAKMKTDYATRDQRGKAAFYVLLWKRKGIKLELFDDYWRDVHGPVCARLPGQHQYWQLHVAHNEGGIWPTVDGVADTCPQEDQFDGIAELTFTTEADRQTWFTSAAILMDDEHNLFSKAIGYNTSPGNSITYVDGIPTGDPNGELGILKFHVLVKKADAVSVQQFRKYMTDSFAPAVALSDSVLKFRLHLFEEVDNSRPDAAGVSHYEPPEKQYQAAFEIAFSNNLEMEKFFASKEYATAVKEQPKYVKQINPFPERSAYTFVYDSQMTLAGQRSSSVAELITKIGATNQLKEDIVSLMLYQQTNSGSQPNGSGSYAQSNLSVPSSQNTTTTTKKRNNYYKNLAADYSRPGLVSSYAAKKLLEDAERFVAMKEKTLPQIGSNYTLEQIEQENKDWWPTHCEALRQARGDILTGEYRDDLVYLCQDGPYYGLEKQKEREKHWWALIAQPGVTMCWPIVMFHGEFTFFEWNCVDDETNETLAKGNVTWVRRGHRGACYLKTEQLTFYRDVFADNELLKLITTA